MPARSAWSAMHAEDADGALVARALDAERVAHLAVLARREDGERAGVRRVREHGAEQHDALDVGGERGVDELGGEALPAARRLGAEQHVQRVGAGAGDPLVVDSAVGVPLGPRIAAPGHSRRREPSSPITTVGRVNW